MGGYSGQSIAGLLSTSAHGSDFDRPPLPDSVKAIHLVGPGGVEHWIEPTNGITTGAAAVGEALGIDAANVHYDDDWFNSALVTVGSMGIIYSLVIEVEPQHDVHMDLRRMLWTAARAQLLNGDAFKPDAGELGDGRALLEDINKGVVRRSLQIVINPFAVDPAGGHSAWMTTRYDLSLASANAPAVKPEPPEVQAFRIFAGPLAGLADIDPNAAENLTTTVLNQPDSSSDGWSHFMMCTAADPPAAAYALEVAFDATTTAYLTFVDEMLVLLENEYAGKDKMALAGWISLRFQGQSRAYLSPQNRAKRTCTVELVGIVGVKSSQPLLDMVEELARQHNGIQHWGMHNNLLMSDVESGAYPNLQKWRRVRWALTGQGTLTTFDSEFVVDTGLNKKPGRIRPPLKPRVLVKPIPILKRPAAVINRVIRRPPRH